MRSKLLILVIILSVHYTCVLAVSSYPYPINITQPDGSKITILLKGDEHFNYAQTTDGYIIVRNTKGIYEYANINTANEIKPTGVKANNKKERDAKEIQYLQTLQRDKILDQLLLKRNSVLKQKSIQETSIMSTVTATPLTGTRKILCILIGFQDSPFSKTQTEFNNLMNQVGYNAGSAIGSVKDFYMQNSYGQLNLDITVVGPYTADHNMAYYGANDAYGNDARPKDLITEAVQKANPNVNYADFDNNNDGYVDEVHVIYAGYAEAAGAPTETIWPHKSTIDVTLDGKKISAYSCSSELKYAWGNNISGIGTICHEIGHALGASDFYDTNYGTGGQFEGTGQWDLMAQGSWNGDEDIPAHHNPYTKTQVFNWATVKSIPTDNSLVTLGPANSNSNSFYKINTSTSGEYFLIENRQQLGFDFALPGHGMMIYHVHSQIESDKKTINATYPQKFYSVCASAAQDPNNTPDSYGSINSAGCPFPGSSNKTAFTDNTLPSAKSWLGIASGARVNLITESQNNVMFVVNPLISGPDALCSSSTATYSISNLPQGATVSWYANGLNLNTTTGTSTTATTVQGAGAGYVRATITSSNTTFTLTKEVALNGYTPIIGPDFEYLSNKKAYFEIDTQEPSVWSVNGDTFTSMPYSNRIVVPLYQYYPGSVLVTCAVSSSCGHFEARKDFQVIGDEEALDVYSIYPNPTSTTFSIKQNEELQAMSGTLVGDKESADNLSIVIYNDQSQLVRQQKAYLNQPVNIDNLREGLYIIHIKDGKKVHKKKLIIKRS
jgi:M6 family metalloprotease-like protein